MPTAAGKGDHHVYRIMPSDVSDQTVLTAGNHYIGVDAVAWFINKADGWFTSSMASGTLDIRLSSGLEKYQAALGTFELKGGAKVAPVFERPILPDRNFRGGPITIAASLTALKKDTVVAGLLKSAANASLKIVAGMVETAGIGGPAQLLTAAGEDLIGGVKKLLSDTAQKREPIFDVSGIEYTIQPDQVVGSHVFLLLHRGVTLSESDLKVRLKGQLLLPFLGDTVLDDGAWLLLRIRRRDEYSGVRDWYERAKALRGKIRTLVQDAASGVLPKAKALDLLNPSATGDVSVFDEFSKLRTIILNDGVLSEREAGLNVGQLNAMLTAAREAINQGAAEIFSSEMEKMRDALLSGDQIPGDVGKAFVRGVQSLAETRLASVPRRVRGRLAGLPSEVDIFSQMRFLPKTIKRASIPSL